MNGLISELREARTDFDGDLLPDGAEPIGAECGMLRMAEEQITALLAALQWYVSNDDTNIGQEGNEYWEAGLRNAKAAIAKATGA